MKFLITEKQDAFSHREGEYVIARDLTGAKRVATRNQLFHGTVLVIKDESGSVLSVKENGEWRDAQ